MRKIILKIYDFLERRRIVTIALLVLLIGMFAILASKINYEEDISKFLPKGGSNNELSKSLGHLTSQNNIAVFFSNKDTLCQDLIIEAMQSFGDIVEQDGIIDNITVTVDQTQMLDIVEAVYAHVPYFLTEKDYLRIDSLINVKEFIDNQLEEDKKILMLPSAGTFARTMTYDPLQLFSPALQKLNSLKVNSSMQIIDDYLFSEDGKYGIVSFESPYGANESGNNANLAKYLDETLSNLSKQYPDIEAVAVGAPLIAVANANQIKKDSLIAVAIALVLIFLILILHYRRFSDIIWVGCSILFGLLFALAGMAVFNDTVSVIVLGIGSVIIGISANYPLHFMDEYKEVGDRREALREMTIPLLIGNITTVAAFFCLVWLDAQAMRDLGLFGALMLIGTILFVLVFLPHFIRKRPAPSERRIFGKLSDIHLSRSKARPYIASVILLLTIIFGFFSTKTSFDSNLSHINYMTPQQRERMQLLSEIQPHGVLYAVAQGEDLATTVENNSRMLSELRKADPQAEISGLGDFLPDKEQMAVAAERWNTFWQDASRQRFIKEFETAANRKGFSVTAFYPFTSMVNNNYGVTDIEDFNDITQPFIDKFVFIGENDFKIMNYVYSDKSEKIHEKVDNLSDDCMVFSNEDIGNQLVSMLNDSFNYIGFVCSIVVFIFLLISFRKVEIAIIAFLPLAVAWIWILGIMHVFGIQFNIVNIILATFIFGQGDDYTIFITEGLLYEHTTGKPRLASYKHSVFISAIIMFIGIGCLIVAKHPALRSLATVTIIGMLTVVLMASFIPPLVFDFLTKKGGRDRFAPITIGRLFNTFIFGLAFGFLAFFVVQPFAFFNLLIGKTTEKKRLRLHKVINKCAQFLTRHTPGVQFNLKNEHNEQFEKPAVIISNHQSHLDILYILSLSPKTVFLTNDNVWKNPIYGYVLRKAECYPVSNGYEANLPKLKDLYSRGYSICIFPEGTRSANCEILRFHKGAFALARELGADILPLYLHGAGHVCPKEEPILSRGSATLEVGERCKPYLDFLSDDTNETDRLTARDMRHKYISHYAEMCDEIENDEYWRFVNHYRNYYKIKI